MEIFTIAPHAAQRHERHTLMKMFVRYLNVYDRLSDGEKQSDDVKIIHGGVIAALSHFKHTPILRIVNTRRK